MDYYITQIKSFFIKFNKEVGAVITVYRYSALMQIYNGFHTYT